MILGEAHLTVPCWSPCPSDKNEMKEFFLGTYSSRDDTVTVYNRAWDVRHNMITIPLGKVRLHNELNF